MGVFDVTIVDWTQPVFDCRKQELPDRFDALFEILGAPRVAEAIRTRQLSHLRDALEAQVDLAALDRTLVDVQELVRDARPIVEERREQIRRQARQEAEERGRAAVEAAGMWGHVQDVNEPHGPNWFSIDRAVEIVVDKPAMLRMREFADIERAATPRGQSEPRLWFSVRVLRLGAAVLLVGQEGIGEHARELAFTAARQHATGFADDPLLQAAYRLQRALGRLGWRLAALNKPALDAESDRLRRNLDTEEWLRLDGALGVTGEDNYMRVARLLPRMLLSQAPEWEPDALNEFAERVEATLCALPKPSGFERLLPIGDPWLDSWQEGNPVADLSRGVVEELLA